MKSLTMIEFRLQAYMAGRLLRNFGKSFIAVGEQSPAIERDEGKVRPDLRHRPLGNGNRGNGCPYAR